MQHSLVMTRSLHDTPRRYLAASCMRAPDGAAAQPALASQMVSDNLGVHRPRPILNKQRRGRPAPLSGTLDVTSIEPTTIGGQAPLHCVQAVPTLSGVARCTFVRLYVYTCHDAKSECSSICVRRAQAASLASRLCCGDRPVAHEHSRAGARRLGGLVSA